MIRAISLAFPAKSPDPFRASRFSWFALVLAAALWGGTAATRAEGIETGSPGVVVSVTADRATVRADGVPLNEVLRRLVKAGISVEADPSVNPLVSVDVRNVPLETALRRVLTGVNHVLIWESPSRKEPARITTLQIFEPGARHRMKPVTAGERWRLARNPDTGELYVRNEITLRLGPGADMDRVVALVKRLGGTLTAIHRPSGRVRVRLPENVDAADLLGQLTAAFPDLSPALNAAFPSLDPLRWPGGDAISARSPVGATVDETVREGTPAVAVLDSGMTPGFLGDARVTAGLDATDPSASLTDPHGHGTQMALLASGAVTPLGGGESEAVPTVAVRVLDEQGVTTGFALLEAIDFAANNGAKVLSLSWGSENDSTLLREAMAYAESKGLLVVAAAGNEPTGKAVYPAACDSVIGVGALAPDGTAWDRSNHGDFVDVSAPGFANLPVGAGGDAGAYAGTSIATAIVANAAAAYLAGHPSASRSEVERYLKTRFPANR